MQLVWRANFFDYTGFSQAARGLVLALDARGVNVKIENIDYHIPRIELQPEVQKKLESLLAKKKEPGHISVFHSPPNLFQKQGQMSIGYTYMETSQMVSTYVDQCNQMDGIWTASKHNVHFIKKSGVTVPVKLVRQGININNKIFNPPQQGPFIFLSIFQWAPRKGYDLLIRAFFEEFTKEDDVCLVIKTNKLGYGKNLLPIVLAEIERIRSTVANPLKTPSVQVITDIYSQIQMNQLFEKCHVFVLPSRGEGIGLPYLEAGSYGLPVIATGWGGQTDFLTQENSYLIHYKEVPIPEKWYTGYYNKGQWWAEPDIYDLKNKMRRVYENYQEALQKGRLLRKEIERNYSWEKSAEDVLDALGNK